MKKIDFFVYFIIPILWIIALFTFFEAPTDLIANYWYVSVASFFAAGLANLTAIGGGFIFIPMVVLILNLSPITALKLSLSTEAFGMSSGAITWSRKNIVWDVLFACVAVSSIGMFVGTFLLKPDSFLIKMVFGVVSVVIGLIMLFLMRYRGTKESVTEFSPFFYIVFFLGGLLTSWISIGIGEVVAFLLMVKYKIKTELAVGTGVAVLACNAILGFIFHISLGGIPWELLIFTVPAVILGARTFVLFGKKCNPLVLKIIFSVIAIVDGVVMLLQVFNFFHV